MIHNPIKNHLEKYDFDLFYERILEDEGRSQGWGLHHQLQEDFLQKLEKGKQTTNLVEEEEIENRIPIPQSFVDDDLSETSIIDILYKRRSTALSEMRGDWTVQDLGKLLSLAAGISFQEQASPVKNVLNDIPLRVYPSGGSLYSIKLYFYSRNVSDLADGMYYYDVNHSNLKKVGNAKPDSELEVMFPMTDFNLYPETDKIENVSIMMFLVADFEQSFQKYGKLAYRLSLLEAGHIAQNIQLISTAIHRNSRPFCGFYADRVEEVLGIRKDKYKHCLYTLFLG